MSNPDETTSWTKFIIGFVDDSWQYSNDWNINNTLVLFLKFELLAQAWDH